MTSPDQSRTRPGLVDDIVTPALIVDVPTLDRNIAAMARFFADGVCRLRPHVKAHKTPEIARRQLAAGSCVGLTCATVSEAEAMVGLGDDILIANEVIGASKWARMAALARRVRLTTAVDSIAGVEGLGRAARDAGVTIGVLVDVDVGQGRCGVAPGDAALSLARLAAATAGLELRGVMGYEGHVQPIRERTARESAARESMAALVGTAERLRAAGLSCPVVSAGGTGTFDISGRISGVTEIQAGSYALMDTDYGEVGVPFEQAFFVLGTVVSRPVPDRIVLDGGHKAATKDHGPPGVVGIPGARVSAVNDEHTVIAVPADAAVTIGDRVRLRPSHTDPTMNLHDVIYAVDGTRVVDAWPVVARGYAEHRRVALADV
jgi:D-serine deaminase-like pyridoxal phosphate-dependent protein